MLKKLRNQILAFNLTAMSTLLVVGLCLVYVLAGSNAQAEDRARIRLQQRSEMMSQQLVLYRVEDINANPIIVYFNITSTRYGPSIPPITGRLEITSYEGDSNMRSGSIQPDYEALDDNAPAFFTYSNHALSIILFQVGDWTSDAKVYYDPIGFSIYVPDFESSEFQLFMQSRPKVFPEDVYQAAINQFQQNGKLLGNFNMNSRAWHYAIILEMPPFSDLTEYENMPAKQLLEAAVGFEVFIIEVTDTHQMLNSLRNTLILVGVCAFGLLFLISLFVANRLIRPVEASWTRQQQFISDASHELKTPLSIISANYEVLQKNRTETIESQLKWLESIGIQSGRMQKLVIALLNLTVGNEISPAIDTVNLSELTEAVCTSFEAIVFEKNVQLTTAIEPSLVITADAVSLRSALDAVFDNAVQYTPSGQRITLLLSRQSNQAVLALQNTGVGIDEQDLKHIFDRFFRVDQSRSKETGGFGLGLSIAQNAIERSGGTIDASSDENSVTITIRFKLV
ncbi:MAG: HAMP domain-containing histidine kinase [Coriobacteriia bacterium]|nr:HAMP domain-containing histidine kinase [Coriobacteriia bacterium]